ncbi:Precorrin-4 C(11)-methyltransferase [Desulfonema limicola]|uniref:Precorrin-4 C(11)-methyltransferase n=1 Tax=Desulfonema limicola TaxID=45656 RepID=A0A975GHB6_9BACT|nr:precorrin-4 C(11)-methyltransferase [Desulfonema limicola]QTA81149.1 Precorrin-4 C(11)-methyltransferase [Desulfonema limicola]
MTSYPVLFVGAGPGDPELITVKGQKALQEADLVIYAGSLVPQALLQWTKPGCGHINSASMHLEEFVSLMIKNHKSGKKVVRLHTGDPSLYGAIAEQTAELKKHDVPFNVIPGVTAAFGAAAAMGIEYTLPEITQTLILTRISGRTPVPESENLESLAAHKASMAVYLSISMIDRVAEILERTYGKDCPAAVACCVSQPDERIFHTTVSELPALVKKENIRKQALIIVSRVLDDKLQEANQKSRLYDKSFSHEYRNSRVDPVRQFPVNNLLSNPKGFKNP